MNTQAGVGKAVQSAAERGANRLRIIGGRWRGTRLLFPQVAAIRPTPDRVRETLFNWLQQHVVDARCLDLFAGSGALGLEALSRGARSALFVDQELPIAAYLRATLQRLQCNAAEVRGMDALHFLQQTSATFDLVFLDPPFAASQSGNTAGDLLPQLFRRLATPDRLSERAWVYLECPAALGPPTALPDWPAQWRLYRSKQAGQVGYHLARRGPPDASP